MNKTTDPTPADLPAYRVIYADGTSYVTSMARNVTLEKARAYFIDASIEQPDGSCKRVADVQPTNNQYTAVTRTEIVSLGKKSQDLGRSACGTPWRDVDEGG